MSIAAAAITAAGQTAGSGITSAGNKRAVKEAANQNRKMYDYQRGHALEDYNMQRADALADWNRENEYNTPAAQMARYRDAGLNPNLIYGVAASSGQADNVRGTETRSSQWGNAEAARYNIDFGMAQAVQNSLIAAQAEKLKAETRSIEANIEKTGTETDRIRQLLPLEKDGMTVNIELARKNADKITSEILKNSKDLEVADQQIIESNARAKKILNDIVIDRLELENAIRRTDISAYDAETNRQNARTNSRNADTNRLNAETRQGELVQYSNDVRIRKSQNAINWRQQMFNEKLQNARLELQKVGLGADIANRSIDNILKGISLGAQMSATRGKASTSAIPTYTIDDYGY